MSRILITGANGFLGRNLCKDFSDAGFEVFAWLRSNDIKDIGTFRPEYVVHCAGEVHNEQKMIESNIILTENVLKQVSGYHYRPSLKRFIYLGSSSEYGRMTVPSSETDIPNPTSMYEATKTSGAMIAQAYGKKCNFKVSIVRPYSIFGEFESPDRFIPTIYRSAKNGEVVKIYDGAHDFLYVKDFVEAVRAIITANEPSDIVNIGSGICTSNGLLVQTFEAAFGKSISKQLVQSRIRDYDSDYWCANISYLKRTYGWSPRFSLEQGLKDYIRICGT